MKAKAALEPLRGARTYREIALERYVQPDRAGTRKHQAAARPGRVRCGEIASIPVTRGSLRPAATSGRALPIIRLSAVRR